jgi:hypothetical protein
MKVASRISWSVSGDLRGGSHVGWLLSHIANSNGCFTAFHLLSGHRRCNRGLVNTVLLLQLLDVVLSRTIVEDLRLIADFEEYLGCRHFMSLLGYRSGSPSRCDHFSIMETENDSFVEANLGERL